MKNPKDFDKPLCIFCNEPFFRARKIHKGKYLPKGVRGVNCVTCSSKCSREYNRYRNSKEFKITGKKQDYMST